MPRPLSRRSIGNVAAEISVSRVTSDSWDSLAALFGRSGASNGCWCQYWLLGPEYHRRDRALNRDALHDELPHAPAPGPGLIARSADGAPVGWARLTPRSELSWLRARFGDRLPAGDDVWAMPCFFVGTQWRGLGVMVALIAAGVNVADEHGLSALEAYPIDSDIDGATRNRFSGVLQPFLDAGFTEVSRLTEELPVVRYLP